MPNPSPELPDLLLRPVGGNHELRHVFRSDLEERLTHSDPAPGEDTAEDAAAWLSSPSSEFPARVIRTRGITRGLGYLALILLIAALSVALYEAIPGVASSFDVPHWLRQAAARQIFLTEPQLSPACKIIDEGRRPYGIELKGALRLWRAHPDDPVFFANYCRAMKLIEERLPDDYEQTWRRIDPDNGYWLLLQAQSSPPGVAVDEVAKQMVEATTMSRRSYFQEILVYNAGAYRPPGNLIQTLFSNEIRQDGDATFAQELGEMALDYRWATPADQELGFWAQEEIETVKAQEAYASPRAGDIEGVLFPGFRVAWWRFGCLVGALAFLLAAGLLWLRLRPLQSPAGQLTACLSQLVRPWAVVIPTSVAGLLSLGTSALVYYLTTSERDEGVVCLTGAPLAILVTAMVMIATARRQVRLRTAFLGLRGPRFQRIAGRVLVACGVFALAGTLLYAYALTLPRYPEGSSPMKIDTLLGILGGLGALSVLWIGVTAVLGYTSPTANLRHRLIARQMIPAALVMSVFFSILTVASLPVEIAIVRHAMEGRGR